MALVLITRSRKQASKLAEGLRAAGHEPILIPTIELAEPSDWRPFDMASSQLGKFHWLLFTSANAVEAFINRVGTEFSPMPNTLKIAAIGPATALALQDNGLNVHLVPSQAVAESLAAELLPHVLQADGSPTRFLLLRAETARDVLSGTLRSAGAEVVVVPVYRNVVPVDSVSAIRELFKSPVSYPDAITFTSSSTATNLLALLDAAEVELPPTVLRISIGPITSQTLRELKLPPHAEATEATVAALIEAVIQALNC